MWVLRVAKGVSFNIQPLPAEIANMFKLDHTCTLQAVVNCYVSLKIT